MIVSQRRAHHERKHCDIASRPGLRVRPNMQRVNSEFHRVLREHRAGVLSTAIHIERVTARETKRR